MSGAVDLDINVELLSQHNWQTTELELAGRGGRGRKREREGGGGREGGREEEKRERVGERGRGRGKGQRGRRVQWWKTREKRKGEMNDVSGGKRESSSRGCSEFHLSVSVVQSVS